MQSHKVVYRMVLVAVLASVTLLQGTSAAAQNPPQALDGKSFAVQVTNCAGGQFDDVYCFIGDSMVVANLDCNAGPAQTIGPLFASFVSDTAGSQRVLFLGLAVRSRISGTAFEVTSRCKSTFNGQEIPQCTCPPPAAGQQGTTPYKP